MKNQQEYTGFEQGPIRPPSEAESLLIRITRNCPWNRCTFCPVYKGESFSLRPVDHVLRDIDSARDYVNRIREARESGSTLLKRKHGEEVDDRNALHAAYQFVAGGMRSIFLQDGNSLVIKPERMIRILEHLTESFPTVTRITSYARSHTIARISDQHLRQMREAGLNRIHIGLESGSDAVLKRVKKGVDKATHIRAGQKVKEAGIQLSEYYMPGLGGNSLWRENALETADCLNQINPDFIRLRSLAMPQSAPLTDQYLRGDFDKMGEVGTARELHLFLDSLESITSRVVSDHILNLFPEVDGKLPEDKEKIMRPVKEFLDLSPEDQLLFCIGRRANRIGRIGDLQNPVQRGYALELCKELGATVENMDEIIEALTKRYI